MMIKKNFCALIILLCTPLIFSQEIKNGVLTINSGATEIKTNAYYGNKDIKKVIIPSSVTKIGNLAFHSCENLKEIEIPSSVRTIGNAAFQNCTSLTKIKLQEGLTNLSFRLFKNTAIKEIEIPTSVTTFDKEVFAECKNLKSIKVDKYSDAHAFFSADTRLAFSSKAPLKTREEWLKNAKNDIVVDGVLYIKPGTTEIAHHAYYNNKSFTRVQIPSSVTLIANCAFYGSALEEVAVPGSVKKIEHEAFRFTPTKKIVIEEGCEEIGSMACYTSDKNAVIYIPDSVKTMPTTGGYAGIAGPSHKWIVVEGSYAQEYHNGRCPIQFDRTKPYSAYSGAKLKSVTIDSNLMAGYFKNCPNLSKADIGPLVSEIPDGLLSKNVSIRTKRGTYADSWAKSNGYYLCGVLADLNTYTKDKSKQIEEDFTRILCDDDSYANWTSYSFKLQEPLKIEDVKGKLVLTSFMLKPCENVTVTKNGKPLISKKTIQPLTRTVLCDFDFISDNLNDYKISTDDAFYKRLVSIPTKWNISFNGFVRRPSTSDGNLCETACTVHAREWIALIYDMAYTLGLPEYSNRCYKAVKNKTLATNDELTEFLTKEQMDELLKKALNYSLVLGRCKDGYGLGGGNVIYLMNSWILGISTSTNSNSAHAFYHEFSHCMDWGHNHGNMCNLERPDPWGKNCWPNIASILYTEELKKGNPPYIEGKSFFNSNLFSKDRLAPQNPADDVIKGGTLYIADGMPHVDSTHKKQTDFTKAVLPQSVEVIDNSAFYGTKISSINLPSGLRRIGKLSFHNCADLKSVDIPDSVESIGEATFQNCSALSSAKIGGGLRQVSYRLFKSSGLEEITVPSSVKQIGKEAFADCKNLKKVVIKNGVKEICDNAFWNSAFPEIEIPASVTKFGKNITSKNVTWIVEKGSQAEKYAIENNYYIKPDSQTTESNAPRIIAEGKNASPASPTVWKKGDFTAKDIIRSWDFSSNLSGSGAYTITFAYTGGACRLCLTDSLFVADGKAIAYFPEMRSAGSNPKVIVFSVTVPEGTKKLELYALAHTGGGTDSNGTITVTKQR